MKLKLNYECFDKGLEKLSQEYKIFAPVVLEYKGTYSDTPSIRYKEVKKFEDMEFALKSHFSPKEVMLPINEILLYFTQDEYSEAKVEEEKVLIFMRACDINAVKRVDEIYLRNGEEDYYYKRRRNKVKFVLVGCRESFRNCFCVSMNSNKTEDYAMALNIRDNELYIDIKDKDLNVFDGQSEEFEVDYVKENYIKVEIPENIDPIKVSKAPIWEEYNARCISCGRCNFVCPTCTCFTMQDIFYKENKNVGERRRVWASCQVDGFTDIAGGHSFRNSKGDRLRFKAMHKIYDFNKRFGYQMCVGCGRCDDNCPQYISFSTTIDKINEFLKGDE